MTEANLVVDLVKNWGDYEKNNSNHSLINFCLWYLNNANKLTMRPTADPFESEIADLKIGELIHRVNKFYELYAKTTIEETGISNVEDFVFLSSLVDNRDVSKSTLIDSNILEPPSGFDVIKRLEAELWADSVPDSADKRTKLIRITAKGQRVLKKNEPSILKASETLVMPLNFEEKNILISALELIDNFHSKNYSKRFRELSFEEMKKALENSNIKQSGQ